MIETKLYSLLSGSTLITTLAKTRIYPIKSPQEPTYPHIIYTRISGGQQNGLDGYLTLENPRIQIDIYSTSYSQAKTLSGNVHTVMQTSTTQSFRNTLTSDNGLWEEQVNKYRVSMDFSCWNRE